MNVAAILRIRTEYVLVSRETQIVSKENILRHQQPFPSSKLWIRFLDFIRLAHFISKASRREIPI